MGNELTSNGFVAVDGVLERNTVIRNEHLIKHGSKYFQVTENLNPAIGEAANIRTMFPKSLTDGKALYDYTYDASTDYGRIRRVAVSSSGGTPTLYSVSDPSSATLRRWNGQYDNYIDYVDSVYGKEYTYIHFINELFSDVDLNSALNLNKVGVVKDINVPAALAGINTTNINNYSGTDTRLGRLSNQMYSNMLYHSSTFNSTRLSNREKLGLISCITPGLQGVLYGNYLTRIASLSDILVPDPKTGRVDNEINALLGSITPPDNTEILKNEWIDAIMNGIKPKLELADNQSFYENDIVGNTISSSMRDGIGYNQTVSKVNEEFIKDSPPKNYWIYANSDGTISTDTDDEWNVYDEINKIGDVGENNLLIHTNKLFQTGKIETLFTRYYLDGEKYKSSVIDTAIDDAGCRSRGRNLRKKTATGETGPNDNPYCRTWIYNNQYNKVSKQIRPFNEENRVKLKNAMEGYRSKFSGIDNGGTYLEKNTVLNLNNGRPNVAPSNSGGVPIEKCMFSIENLAWKDVNKNNIKNLSPEQKGPNGGRIMWFPPYGLSFNESVNVDWESNTFIGRGENVYTYKNTNRVGNLSFTLLIDHPAIINSMRVDNVTDMDILRFFAGCDVPEGIDKATKDDETINPANSVQETTDNGQCIEVKVFFPNNYSGHMNNIDNTDDDWIKYLLTGANAVIRYGSERGYEIGKSGITNTQLSVGTIGSNNKKKTFWYRVDKDLRQDGLDDRNYKDTNSYKLNKVKKDNSKYFTLSDVWYNNGNVENSFLTQLSGKIITNIEVEGGATTQDGNNSSKLAKRRGKTLFEAITNILDSKKITYPKDVARDIENKIKINKIDMSSNSAKDVNTEEAKLARYASVKLYYNQSTSEVVNNIPATAQTSTAIRQNSEQESSEDNRPINSSATSKVAQILVTPNRYESESDYFYKLQNTDPLIFKHIKDKIKYFDPAYHSMSPEGFNARLTFLQQCTRQGHTISATENDGSAMTAGNLAFGRMPVCVLRIGDFIHTKIIINSLSINYDVDSSMQWDLNEEGAGVQPMMAKVNMSITILGGQSLEAPINRLQNAVSFNYYANAGVYDDRADRANLQNEKLNYEYLFTPEK